ncbi:MAG: uncharacterized protein JWL62_2639 [Hyphomicrobiales bacterium]|nr:uncharacterized protein [Hyphomicrobiales bacterium]
MSSFSWLSRATPGPAAGGLHFSNPSRTYNVTKRCVSFWAYSATFEVAFDLAEDALDRMSPNMTHDDDTVLRVFDLNRARIEKAADVAHSRDRKNYHWLAASEF